MRPFILFILISFTLEAIAQTKESFYDFFWKPCAATEARFYSIIEKKDSGWLRKDYFVSNKQLQMQVLYEDEACKIPNGHMYYFHANGNLSVSGKMKHGKQEGICLSYHFNGMIMDSADYHNGRPVGSKFGWHSNGYPSDSTGHVNDSMDIRLSWFEDGSVESAGYLLYNKKYGKWQYFHRTGGLAAVIVYSNGKPVDKQYFKEDGSPQTDTSGVNRAAEFAKGGLSGWKKYLEKNISWPAEYKFSNGNMATAGVSFIVNENGKVEDVHITTPFHPVIDKRAADIIRNSPAWQPAVYENRKIKSLHTQPVTFIQREE